jgi:hypothetical protein
MCGCVRLLTPVCIAYASSLFVRFPSSVALLFAPCFSSRVVHKTIHAKLANTMKYPTASYVAVPLAGPEQATIKRNMNRTFSIFYATVLVAFCALTGGAMISNYETAMESGMEHDMHHHHKTMHHGRHHHHMRHVRTLHHDMSPPSNLRNDDDKDEEMMSINGATDEDEGVTMILDANHTPAPEETAQQFTKLDTFENFMEESSSTDSDSSDSNDSDSNDSDSNDSDSNDSDSNDSDSSDSDEDENSSDSDEVEDENSSSDSGDVDEENSNSDSGDLDGEKKRNEFSGDRSDDPSEGKEEMAMAIAEEYVIRPQPPAMIERVEIPEREIPH